MKNAYAEAITAIQNMDDRDLKSIVFEIARKNPAALVSACCRLKEKPVIVQGWEKNALPFLKDGDLIGAIKQCRYETHKGLKDAKEACEDLRDRLIANRVRI